MADESVKTFVFPENGTGANGGVDPNLLLSSMMNGNGGFGGNGNWIWVIFLFFLYGWNRNGGLFGGGNGTDAIASTAERDMLMQAINGNGAAISNLASTLNCDINAVQTAISSVQSSIQSVGNQVGLSGQQVINAIQQGNMQIASQLSTCCCENKQLVQKMGYDNQIAILNQTNALQERLTGISNGLQNGFASIAYETQSQTCNINQNIQNQTQSLKDTANANNQAILAKLSEMQANALQDKLSALQNTNTALRTQIDNANQTAAVAAMLQPIQAEVQAIKAAQPATATVQYPNLVGVPLSQALGYGYGYGYGGGGFWG